MDWRVRQDRVDPLRGPLPAAAELHVDVELVDSIGNTTTTGHTRPLLGPGQVTGIDAAQIIRFEPAPGSTGVETNYFPFVELLAPDLPWLLTPASPGPDGGLRPWLVLIVVEEGAGVTFDSAGTGSAGTITVDADQIGQQLWDLADSYAWTHVQSSVADTAIAAAVEAGSGTVIARMLCPRKLRRSRSYRAAVVPAFEAGRAAGLGLPLPAGDLTPAWTLDQTEPAELPVFATWTFATSAEAGDFESLAQRLQPDSGGGRIGVHPCRLDTGGLLPAPDPALDLRFEYAGALTDPDLAPTPCRAHAPVAGTGPGDRDRSGRSAHHGSSGIAGRLPAPARRPGAGTADVRTLAGPSSATARGGLAAHRQRGHG